MSCIPIWPKFGHFYLKSQNSFATFIISLLLEVQVTKSLTLFKNKLRLLEKDSLESNKHHSINHTQSKFTEVKVLKFFFKVKKCKLNFCANSKQSLAFNIKWKCVILVDLWRLPGYLSKSKRKTDFGTIYLREKDS